MNRIREQLGIEPKLTAGRTGQFEVIADGETVVTRGGNFITRKFGMGYPPAEEIVDMLQQRL